MNNVRMQTKMR